MEYTGNVVKAETRRHQKLEQSKGGAASAMVRGASKQLSDCGAKVIEKNLRGGRGGAQRSVVIVKSRVDFRFSFSCRSVPSFSLPQVKTESSANRKSLRFFISISFPRP